MYENCYIAYLRMHCDSIYMIYIAHFVDITTATDRNLFLPTTAIAIAIHSRQWSD